MANEDPFSDISSQQPPTASAPKPLGNTERLVLQNLFDTQPARRIAYLKRLGYEMNPKDDNEYRPIGSGDDVGYGEIDPGYVAEFERGWLAKAGKGLPAQMLGGITGVGKEVAADLGDVAYDTGVAGPASVAGAAIAGPTGAAAGPGAPIAIPVMAVLGGAAGNAAAEGFKSMVGDLMLDENVPVDKQSLVIQSVMAGLAPKILQGGAKLAKQGWNTMLHAQRDAIVNAAKQSGGGLTEDILNKAVKNPEMFSRQAVDGANGKLANTYKQIFGLEDPLKLDAPERVTGGMFGEKMSVLNAQANSEIERLGKEPGANFKVEEIAKPMKVMLDQLNDKFSKTEDEKAAYAYLKGKYDELNKKTAGAISPILNPDGKAYQAPAKDLTFKDAREFMTSIQSEMSAKTTAGDYINPAGRVLGPVLNGKTGVLKIINDKAASVGSNLPQLNAQRHRVLTAYNTAAETLTPSNLTSAFVGTDTVKKDLIRGATVEMDSILGTNLAEEIENGSMQRVVENLYKNPKGFGSGNSNAQKTVAGIKGAIKGGAVGLAVGAPAGPVGMGVGLAAGATGGAVHARKFAAEMANPESALQALTKNSSQLAASEAELALPQKLGIPAQIGASEVGREAGVLMSPAPQEKDPFADLDPFSDL